MPLTLRECDARNRLARRPRRSPRPPHPLPPHRHLQPPRQRGPRRPLPRRPPRRRGPPLPLPRPPAQPRHPPRHPPRQRRQAPLHALQPHRCRPRRGRILDQARLRRPRPQRPHLRPRRHRHEGASGHAAHDRAPAQAAGPPPHPRHRLLRRARRGSGQLLGHAVALRTPPRSDRRGVRTERRRGRLLAVPRRRGGTLRRRHERKDHLLATAHRHRHTGARQPPARRQLRRPPHPGARPPCRLEAPHHAHPADAALSRPPARRRALPPHQGRRRPRTRYHRATPYSTRPFATPSTSP